MSWLAEELLRFDQAFPGEPDELVEVPGETWARWLALANPEAASSPPAPAPALPPSSRAVGSFQYELGLIACSAKKWPTPAKARDFYLGDLFKKSLALAEQQCRDVRILSAEHYVVHPDDVLEPYDNPLKARSALARRSWGATVAGILRHLRPTSVLCLAPKSYWRHIVDAGTPDGRFRLPKFDCPLEGLGIGQQKAALKQRRAA